ncbi:alcohol dehydrogenase [Tulasnella sp. 418]|nr:alcohol dehydrogenase [Tulasnella sp. 418]
MATNVQIPPTQSAAIFYQRGGPVEVRNDIPVTQPKDLKPGEVLVKIEYSGVCHTDLHAMLGDWPIPSNVPLIGGHEGAGRIVAIAPHTDTELKIGDAVGIKWLADSCLKCQSCRKGYEPVCQTAKLHGYTVDGSFQQYAVSYAHHVSKIPESLPLDEAAPILCAGVTVYKAIKQANCTPGETIVIPGSGGGLGHLAVQYATAMGYRVIGIDTGDEKEKLSRSLGCEEFIDFKKTKDLVADIKKLSFDGQGPAAAIVAAAGAAAYEQALEYIRPFGTLVAVGLPPDAFIKADVFYTVFYSKRIVGSYVGNRQDAEEALDLAARGKVKTLYKVLPLSSLPEVYHKMHNGQIAGRIVLDMSK